jgi:hypothetical protein
LRLARSKVRAVRRAVLALCIVLLGASCGGSHTISSKNLGQLVLTTSDLGPAFAVFGDGPQITADNVGTPRSDPARFGRRGGWVARFRRSGTKATRGPLIVESRTDVFAKRSGAASDLDEYRTMLLHQKGAAPKELKPPAIGDDAVETTFTQPGLLPVRYYRLAWRYRNATASLTVAGWDGKVGPADVARLAQRQQNRLRHG